VRNWEDAADYVRWTNAIAFPDFKDQDWRKFARRTFRACEGVPVLDYDPAIALALTRSPGRVSQWMAGWLFRKLARKHPTLLIRGQLSDVINDEIAARMQRAAPGLQQCVVPNVGHAPMLTEREAVDAIARFLRTVA
jgi:pimeloyl-ACP methyl ester carboxylesterase